MSRWRRFVVVLTVTATAVLAPVGSAFVGAALATTSSDCSTVCYVDAVNGNDANSGDTISAAKKTIQAALNVVSAGGEVHVLPGTYNEAAPGSTPTSLPGTYQFGLFFHSSKPGITLMGVTAADEPITYASATEATINTDATNNFGYSGIFVEAADTTIQGVEIGPNAAGDNKTIEVVADNFTLQYSRTDIPNGGGSVYINDFSDSGNVVQSYHVLDNIFPDGTSVDISSGAGSFGPVSGREILDNTFDLNGADWNAISFNGSGTGVPWFVNTVGGAVIEGNSFSGGSLQYIRARGTYDNSQFDWESYWEDNAYDRAAVALVTESPFDVRTFSYTAARDYCPGGMCTFNNVRRIGATIQGEVDHTLAGDTVLVGPGIYDEVVDIGKQLTLTGMPGAVIRPDDTTQLLDQGVRRVAIYVDSADGVTVQGFEIDGTGGTLHYGINFFNSNLGVVSNNVVHDITNEIGAPGYDVAGAGILFFGWGQGIDGAVVDRNTVYDTGRHGIFIGGMDSVTYDWLLSAGDTISRNTVYNTWQGPTNDFGAGIQMNGAKNCLIDGNTVHHTG